MITLISDKVIKFMLKNNVRSLCPTSMFGSHKGLLRNRLF